ncbi:MAG: SPOR domain-containing protein [Pseudomonadota bacterium]
MQFILRIAGAMSDSQTLKRYRVTGSLFLLALAAILGPMLFDGAGLEAPELAPMPARTDAEPVVPPADAFEGLDAVAEEAAALRARADERLFQASPSAEASSSGVAGAATKAEPAKPAATDTALERLGEPSDLEQAPLAQPTLRPVSATTSIWAVQVGSFSRRDNAVALRQSLRDRGFEAFLSDVKVRSEVRTRVAVGPYLSEGDAERARRSIRDAFKLDPKLVAMVI